MNELDQHNLGELTKGGQPATAVGPLGPQDLSLKREVDESKVWWDERHEDDNEPLPTIIGRPNTDLVEERGWVAYSTALDLGYGQPNALKFRVAAMSAARVGLAPSGILRSAGRVRLGTVKTFGGTVITMSILLDSGAYYDPTKVSSPGNNSVGSD